MKNYSEKVQLKEYWKDEKAKKWSLPDWGSVNGNFGGFCNVIAGKASPAWFQKSVVYRVIERWLRACLAGRSRVKSHFAGLCG